MKNLLKNRKFQKRNRNRRKNRNQNLKPYYYHITDLKNIESIKKHGLKANEDGEIFLFDNISIIVYGNVNYVADCIADGQICLEEYAMFEISSKGFQSELQPDDVGEFSARYQYILNQEIIDPHYISHFGNYRSEYRPFLDMSDLIEITEDGRFNFK